MTEATITIEDLQGAQPAKIVHIAGQLDESNVDSKVQEIYQTVESAAKGLSLIFDLEGLDYMNSKSIGYLTDLYGKITEGGGKVAIAKAKPNIVDILQVVGLTQLIQNFSSLEEAKAHVASSEGAEVAPAVEATPAESAPVTPETPVAQTPAAPIEVAPVQPETPAPAPAPAPQADIQIQTPEPQTPVQPVETADPVAPVEPTVAPQVPQQIQEQASTPPQEPPAANA